MTDKFAIFMELLQTEKNVKGKQMMAVAHHLETRLKDHTQSHLLHDEV